MWLAVQGTLDFKTNVEGAKKVYMKQWDNGFRKYRYKTPLMVEAALAVIEVEL